MFGTNTHFGVPFNANAIDRVPGGSSCGSAAAVAAGLCDFAFGTDTAGSCRTPASFCGIFGIRTSHGRISTAGIMPMAPSFDAVGWLARDAETLRRVGALFFGDTGLDRHPRFLLATDAFAIAEPRVAGALLPIARALAPGAEIHIYDEPFGDWPGVFAPLQLHELWTTLGRWATEPRRALTAGVRDRIASSATTKPADVALAMQRRDALARRLIALLGDDGILVLPTTHDLPPLRDADAGSLHAFREKTLALTAVASLARAPQISLPVARVDGIPAGLSLLAAPGRDALLLDVAVALARPEA
jgi:amidase